MSTLTTIPKFAVGDEIMLPIGRNLLPGRVVEDRGNLGPNGERIMRVEVDLGEGVAPSEYEVPEAALERPARR